MNIIKPKDVEPELIESRRLANTFHRMRAEITPKMPETVANF